MAKAKQTEKAITFHNGQYRASIGYELKGEDGPIHDADQIQAIAADPTKFMAMRKPRVWMLTGDVRVARPYLDQIKHRWKLLKHQSKFPVWDEVSIGWAVAYGRDLHTEYFNDHDATEAKSRQLEVDHQHVTRRLRPATTTLPSQKASTASGTHADTRDAAGPVMTLAGGVDAYGKKLEADVQSGDRSRADATRQMTSMKQFIRFIADQPYNPDEDPKCPKKPDTQAVYFAEKFKDPSPVASRPLNDLAYDQINAFVLNMKNRRVSGYAPLTIRDACKHVDNLLGWLEDRNFWRATCNYGRLLTVKMARLYTPVEAKQKAKGQKTYTADELAELYAYGNEQQRLYVMLGLNMCAAQQTLADLLVEDVHLDDQPHVEFVRGKTRHSANGGNGIEIRYDLWPLTAKLLHERMKQTPNNEAGLALMTSDGHPLVRFNAGPKKRSKSDSVGSTFKKLLTAANQKDQKVRPLGFKYIRKTVSSMVLELTDLYTQQQVLAQSRKTVAAINYTGKVEADFIPKTNANFTRMNDALKAIWKGLEPKFMAAAARVEAERRDVQTARRAAYIERQRASKRAVAQRRRDRELVEA